MSGQAAKKSRVALHFHFMVTLGRDKGRDREEGGGCRVMAAGIVQIHTHTELRKFN